MKKKILLVSAMVAMLFCLFAISSFAANNIIKLDTCPTLAEIHANREAYVSHLDAFDGNEYGEKDSESVVVLSDLQDPPTYYVYPSYYYIQSTSNSVRSQLPKLNAAIAEADPSAFASYVTIEGNYTSGSCVYLIRFEVPTYVTTLEARAKFESSSNLLEVFFPTKTVIDEETGLEKTVTYITNVSGQNLFTSCTSLEYVHNMEYLPIGIVQGNADGFASCNALKEIKIPDGVTSIPATCFKNCWSVKEVVLPNSVTYMGKGVFCNCYSLESVTIGANFSTFASTNSDYEHFMNCNKLKFVYMPATVLGTLEAKANNYKSIFGVSSKVVYFVTGTEDEAIYIRDWFKTTNANENIGNADMAAYDQGVDYVALQAELKKSIIVYGYSACEAFYNGVHDVPEYFTIEYSGQEFLSSAIKSKACANCTFKVDRTDLAPLFECLGYSSNEMGDIVQGFCLNIESLEAYESVLGKISYGVIAAVDKRADGERTEGVDIFGLEKYLSHDLSKSPFNYFNVRISGITDSLADQYLFFCAYATYGEECIYINDGASGKTAISTTYNLSK